MFGWGHICIYDLTYMRNHKYHLQFLQTSGFLIRGSARTWVHSQSSSASPPRTQLPSISGAETETANPTSYQSATDVTDQARVGEYLDVSFTLGPASTSWPRYLASRPSTTCRWRYASRTWAKTTLGCGGASPRTRKGRPVGKSNSMVWVCMTHQITRQ